jgi:hypothetical protein
VIVKKQVKERLKNHDFLELLSSKCSVLIVYQSEKSLDSDCSGNFSCLFYLQSGRALPLKDRSITRIEAYLLKIF